MKTFPVLIAFSLVALQVSHAQFSDDFSDANLSADPSWSGTTAQFIINASLELQLNANAAGTAWLSAEISLDIDKAIQWEFFIKQSFSPSGANFGRYYLMSDQADLTSSLNGYYLQFGEAGSNDAVELFRQSGTQITSVCRAPTAGIASAFAMSIKVIRRDEGTWELYTDYSGGTSLALEASGIDRVHEDFAYSGLLCVYTVTNATRFYFDDIRIGNIDLPDTSPPEVAAVNVLSSRSLKISFTEAVDASAEIPENYFVAPSVGYPLSADPLGDGETVMLSFGTDFINGVNSTLTVMNVRDVAGNTLSASETSFLYFVEEPVFFRDIIISEIFADPSPQVALPDAEFVELYNRSPKAIDLSGWVFSDEVNSAVLPPIIVPPGNYVIVTSANDAAQFVTRGTVLAVSTFPTLNNSQDILTIRNDEGMLIDSVKYVVGWYGDDEKAEGGWSLELIDPQNICADGENWIGAEEPQGGTPGKQNSVYANKPDNTGPMLTGVIPLDSVTLLIAFNEKLDRVPPLSSQFLTDPSLAISSVEFSDASLMTLLLILAQPIRRGETYSIGVSGIQDCPGNRIQEDFAHAIFVLPEKALPGDIVINELLFNPRPTGVDFVEIYNASSKVIDLKDWSLRNYLSLSGSGETTVSTRNLMINPGEYWAFTADANLLKGEYLSAKENALFETTIPPLNDDEGCVTILDHQGVVIDSMYYSRQLHSPFVKDDEGISLERIAASSGSTQPSNWRSASSTCGFATPGLQNSNVRPVDAFGEGDVVVDPEIIQPQVAQHDFSQIRYRFQSGGFIANIKVVDQRGRVIRQIASNALLGSEGFFRWDGEVDNGSVASTGYYMVWFEVFDTDGTVKTFRKRVVVF